MKERTIVGLGELLWDLLPEGKQIGGAPANFAYHAQQQGAQGVVVSCVGDDDLGQEIVSCLMERGLDVDAVSISSQYPTGTVSVELDEEGKPNYIIHEDVAWDFLPWNDFLQSLAERADAVCFGTLAQRSSISRDTIQRFLKSTRPKCLKIYDINLRQEYYNRLTIEESLHLADVLKLNEEELPVIAELLDLNGFEKKQINTLISLYGLKLVALTKGDCGSLLITSEDSVGHPGIPPDRIVDTVGAGDSYTAVIALGLLNGRPIKQICEQANHLASFVCTQQGAMPKYQPGEVFSN